MAENFAFFRLSSLSGERLGCEETFEGENKEWCHLKKRRKMPPGGRGRLSGHHHAGASIAAVVNSTAPSDGEARRRILRTFVPLLLLVCVADASCSVAMLRIRCGGRENDDDGPSSSSSSHCLRTELLSGLRFRPFRHDDGGGGVGDLFWLAAFRCASTAALLLTGIRCGRAAVAEETATTTTTTVVAGGGNDDEGGLAEPLLSSGSSSSSSRSGNGEDDADALETQAAPPKRCCRRTNKRLLSLEPHQARNAVLVTLFVTGTVYQLYAGLKVSSYHGEHSTVIVVLMCLTVLWVNAGAYVFRILLTELTRQEGLFLPAEVHRHGLFFEPRGLHVHFCDLCRRRIMGEGCYRCGLCDFDVCRRCAGRSDAATVGENLLRGDGGVRSEASLDNASYFRRALSVARPELPLLAVSFVLLATSSVSRLLLPHFQGRIIDKVLPDKTGSYDRDGFSRYVRLYVFLMIAQGALSTLYSGEWVWKAVLAHSVGESIFFFQRPFRDIRVSTRTADPVRLCTPEANGCSSHEFCILLSIFCLIIFSTLAIFTLISRRLKFTIRNQLLERILNQDIAYFDGTESGRLISRLTNDLDLMMSPIQSSLSSLLSNVLILIGGMAMCFIKSYRLSMLAFVTVGPITYLWDQYAQWSKGLAREMLAHWAEGNSIASQALSHVRTVKAFGCEDKVLEKYSDANKQALDCGVKDAWGNGLTSALTGYLDLGSGVLILWFGGRLVYDGEMSVGELVTFQLFWNMMNSAYQNLQGLVTSFTRSAAGAEKIFSLWDSEPDIDPKKGSDITWDVQGFLELRNVKFYYQMRPDNVVLDKFSLSIPAGKTVALVGRSGGGKSTKLRF
jgi:ABC-type multidrug transport system fused ATPase/permease subunit